MNRSRLLFAAALLLPPTLSFAQPSAPDTTVLPARRYETGRVVAGYGYDGTHGPRLGLGIYQTPSQGHFTGLWGYAFTGTVDGRFSKEPTLFEPAVGAQMWLILLTVGAEIAAPTDFETVWVVPRFHIGLGLLGYRVTFALAVGPDLPPGMGRFGVQLEVPLNVLWEARWR